jgi:hypothetical protein
VLTDVRQALEFVVFCTAGCQPADGVPDKLSEWLNSRQQAASLLKVFLTSYPSG